MCSLLIQQHRHSTNRNTKGGDRDGGRGERGWGGRGCLGYLNRPITDMEGMHIVLEEECAFFEIKQPLKTTVKRCKCSLAVVFTFEVLVRKRQLLFYTQSHVQNYFPYIGGMEDGQRSNETCPEKAQGWSRKCWIYWIRFPHLAKPETAVI